MIEVGAAVTVDWVAETAPAVTVTEAVCVIATALIVADTVLASATVEPRVPVATPLAFVVPTGCVSALPVPVAASTTVAPLIGLPVASRAVTVIVTAAAAGRDRGRRRGHGRLGGGDRARRHGDGGGLR